MSEALPFLLLIFALCILVGLWVALQRKSGPQPFATLQGRQAAKYAEQQLERQLLGMVRGDRAVMERLIDGQSRKQGRVVRSELIERAILNLERDRRE